MREIKAILESDKKPGVGFMFTVPVRKVTDQRIKNREQFSVFLSSLVFLKEFPECVNKDQGVINGPHQDVSVKREVARPLVLDGGIHHRFDCPEIGEDAQQILVTFLENLKQRQNGKENDNCPAL